MEDKCVCCGAIIPEGRQVCPNCQINKNEIIKAIETENFSLVDFENEIVRMILGEVEE